YRGGTGVFGCVDLARIFCEPLRFGVAGFSCGAAAFGGLRSRQRRRCLRVRAHETLLAVNVEQGQRLSLRFAVNTPHSDGLPGLFFGPGTTCCWAVCPHSHAASSSAFGSHGNVRSSRPEPEKWAPISLV